MNSKALEKELYKEVTKVHLSEILPDHQYPPSFDHAIVDGNNKILNFCSSIYKVEHNRDVFQPIEEEITKMKLPFKKDIRIIRRRL